MPKIKAVIFDLDGTLIDSAEAILGAFQHVIEKFGGDYDETMAKSGIGLPLDRQYKTLLPNHDPKQLTELHRNWQIENRHLFKSFHGLQQFLDMLKKQGIKLGAYTSAYRSRTEVMFDVTGIRDYFDAIICGDEITRPKPDGEGVEILAKQMGVKLKEVIMVGDAVHDILCGKNAGVITIGITHGFGTREALMEAGSDYIVDDLQSLTLTLGEISKNGS